MEVVRYADRPHLRERRGELDDFPEFMFHNAMGRKYWDRLYTDFAAFQLAVLDGDELIGEVHALSLPVVGDALPTGWDEAFERGMEAGGGNVVSLLAISVKPKARGKGLPALLIAEVQNIARRAGHESVIAPVRPTLKDRYPLIAIERYVEWRREDGSHFDPWIRTHERLGGVIVGPCRDSMFIQAPVADWQEWTGMEFPEDGMYIVPGMLAPLEVRDGVGTHVEPNVWMRHAL
ncbi:MAG TPA: GNAT family N-acetyltransferase [Gaiellaceae bacterium]